jgi:hypothetical protein
MHLNSSADALDWRGWRSIACNLLRFKDHKDHLSLFLPFSTKIIMISAEPLKRDDRCTVDQFTSIQPL